MKSPARRPRHSLPAQASASISTFSNDFTAKARRRATQDYGLDGSTPGTSALAEKPKPRPWERYSHRKIGRRKAQRRDKNKFRFYWSTMEYRDDDQQTEALYQRFWVFHYLHALYLLLWTLVIASLIAAAYIGIQKDLDIRLHTARFYIALASAGVGGLMLIILHFAGSKRRLQLLKIMSLAAVGLMWAVYVALVVLTTDRTSSSYLALGLLIVQISYGSLALTPRVCMVISLLFSVVYIAVSGASANTFTETGDQARQISANVVIFGLINMIGAYVRFAAERQLRSSFQESRECQQKTIHIDSKHKEKDVLLSSLLPEYMIAEVKDDIMDVRPVKTKTNENPLFRKLYITQVSGISILFADIVGFTKLSSGISARELVALLNKLFAKFDNLARKNNCYRIKILGDCYYCVAGLHAALGNSEPRDHARDCVEMGLDVCVAIDSVRKPNTSSSDVDMRVGVHTGNALSGILGQTKWQYDVWSTDVTLANHMESGGIPGKVHMSQQCLDSMLKNSTRQQLDEEFIIEEGHGQDRDAYLKKEEIQTYIIQSKKPRNIGLEVVGSDGEGEPDDASVTTDGPYESVSQHTNGSPKPKRKNGRLRRSRGLQPRGVDTEVVNAAIGEQIEKEQFLVQNGDRSIKMNFFLSIWSTLRSTDCGWLANTYYNGKIEMKYRKREDLYYWNHYPYVMVSAVGLLVVQAIMLPKTWIQLIFLLLLTFLSSFATLVFYAAWMKEKETLVETGPPTMTGETKKIPRSPFILRVRAVVIESVLARDLIALVLILPICACALISSALCDVNHVVEECNGTFIDFNRTQNADSFYCDYPSYYVFSCLLALSTSTIFPGMLFLVRAPVLFLVGTVMAVVLAIPLRDLFLVSDYRRQGFYSSVAILDDTAFESVFMLCLYVVIVIWQSKTMDMAHRLRYQKELDINKAIENLNQIESIKELVLENILPKTIADYYVKFKGDNEQDPDELYAEKHDDVCVMFASIPDYMGYYYEMEKENRTATDGGRESLRILNEIISDFDSVLSKPKFRTVEKIKTIGATYMAACGLSGQTLKCKTDGDDPPAVQGKFKQQKNLETMIEFAAAIQKVFGQIKINAFLEFDMRIGMNCGTVVAGVIGRSKPLYDIWGNTVNVASRMDSTGGQSEIQVTEEVAQVAKAAGYDVSLRGTVFVKGKGDLKTYYILTGLSLRLQAQEKAAAKAKKDQASKAEPSLSPALAAAAAAAPAAPAAAAPPARAAGAGPTKSLAASNTAVTQVEESTADSRAAEAPELAPSKVKIL